MNDRYLYKGKIKGNLTGHEELDWAIGNLIVEQSKGKHFIIDLSHFDESTKLCDVIIEVDPSTICKCTGLKDKNGKLIWENDIVDGHIKRGAAFYRCKVLWNECKARFDVRAMDCNFPMTLDEYIDDISVCGLDYEVIGNISDNPELLEVRE